MKLGMVGLPNVGKSTLFNALTNAGAVSANYPFCTIEPNIGTVSLPDKRLLYLRDIYEPAKFTPATMIFADIAGLVKGASKGEGLGNKFLADIRDTDAIIHVVRCFENDNIIHVDGNINPYRDIEIINLELIFSDLEIISRRLEKTQRNFKGKGGADLAREIELLKALTEFLEEGKSARAFDFTPYKYEAEIIQKEMPLLSLKPIIYAANLSEKDFLNLSDNIHYKKVCEIAKLEKSICIPICAELEAEISELEVDEKELFLADIGINEPGIERVIKAGYELLGLISYFTAGKDEVRAWTIKKGTTAPKAAGKIHTDFERGFIRAEIVSYNDFKSCSGSITAAKEKGLYRSEGKDYIMKDADIVLFRFNV